MLSLYDLSRLRNSNLYGVEYVAREIEAIYENNPDLEADLNNLVTLILDVVDHAESEIEEKYSDGYDDGYDDGYEAGHADGYSEGFSEALDQE